MFFSEKIGSITANRFLNASLAVNRLCIILIMRLIDPYYSPHDAKNLNYSFIELNELFSLLNAYLLDDTIVNCVNIHTRLIETLKCDRNAQFTDGARSCYRWISWMND